jgi:hypothetical protein
MYVFSLKATGWRMSIIRCFTNKFNIQKSKIKNGALRVLKISIVKKSPNEVLIFDF